MFKIFKRAIAYFIDMLVVLVIVQTFSSIPVINKNIDKYNELYEDYMDSVLEYSEFRVEIEDDFEDKELDKEEYDELVSEYGEYQELLDKYYKDEKLSKKNYDKLVKELDDTYMNDYKKTYYKLDKYSIVYNICYVVVAVLYFVGFNLITDGVTLGKKLVRMKIVNNKDDSEKVKWYSYLIRCVMLYQPIYYLFKVIFVNVLSEGNYYNITNVVYDIHSYLLFIILTFAVVRLDGRGLHDLAGGTKVIEVERKRKVVK